MKPFFSEKDKYLEDTDYFRPNNLKDGASVRIRVLSSTIGGWENWSEDNKPTRYPPHPKPRKWANPLKPLKPFRAFLLWNYDLKLVQVWSFSQSYLKESFQSLCDEKGNPMTYDIEVTRLGKGQTTRYGLKAYASKPVQKEIQQIFEETPVNLYALYVNKHPFVDLEAGLEFKDEEDNDTDVA